MIGEEQREIHELSLKVEARANMATLDLREKCSKKAWETYAESGWKKEPMASFTNHYNVRMNKCFILIQNTTRSTPFDGTFFTDKVLWMRLRGSRMVNMTGEAIRLRNTGKSRRSTARGYCYQGEKRFAIHRMSSTRS